jgi:hypothetical protein
MIELHVPINLSKGMYRLPCILVSFIVLEVKEGLEVAHISCPWGLVIDLIAQYEWPLL